MNIYTENPDSKSIVASTERLKHLLAIIPQLLLEISETDIKKRASKDAWSKLEILGHLLDSAVHNHQRFIRIRFEDRPIINYDQNKWVELSDYNSCDKNELIELWKLYNYHLLHIIKNIPVQDLSKTGIVGSDEEEMPLYFYINDYVAHLEHHLRQIATY